MILNIIPAQHFEIVLKYLFCATQDHLKELMNKHLWEWGQVLTVLTTSLANLMHINI